MELLSPSKLTKTSSTQCNSNDIIPSSHPSPNNNNSTSIHTKPSPKKGPYTLGITLGEGAFAKVKLATHNQTKQKIAIKIIDKLKLLKDEIDIQQRRGANRIDAVHQILAEAVHTQGGER